MIKQRSNLSPTSVNTEFSLYDTLKNICQKYSEKITGSDKSVVKKLLINSYEVLLKKSDSNYRGT